MISEVHGASATSEKPVFKCDVPVIAILTVLDEQCGQESDAAFKSLSHRQCSKTGMVEQEGHHSCDFQRVHGKSLWTFFLTCTLHRASLPL